ncbi:MAG: hypothetical protein JW857_12125 [Bacteroidales bacterium]|nr:hypothetical protein [Bacteroidales bacterium]
MLDILNNLFKPSNQKEIPELIEDELLAHFPEALNIDWYSVTDMYEAIFYLSDIEHIAKISLKGKLIEYKKNIKLDDIPILIQKASSIYGEIMSAIAIYSGKNIKYELILRSSDMIRHIFLFNQQGQLLNKTLAE